MSSAGSDGTDYIPIKSRTLIIPKMRTPPLSVKQTGILIMQGCLPPLIDSRTGHYNSTGARSISLWLAFLGGIQQGRALRSAFVALNSISTHALPCLSEIYWKPAKYRHLYIPDMQQWSQRVHYRGSDMHPVLFVCKAILR